MLAFALFPFDFGTKEDPSEIPEDDITHAILTKQDIKDFADLESLQTFIHELGSTSSKWNRIRETSSSMELKGIIGNVDSVLRQNLPIVVVNSLNVARQGQVLALDAIALGKSIQQDAPKAELERFITGTRELANCAKADADKMAHHFRAVRKGIFQALESIDKKYRRRSFAKIIKDEVSGLRKSLRDIRERLTKQEEFVGLLVQWWTRVEEQMRYIQRSLDVITLGDSLRKQVICEHWEVMKERYDSYIAQVARIQDQNSILRIASPDFERVPA